VAIDERTNANANPLDSTTLEGLAMHAPSFSLLLKHLPMH